MKEDEFNEKCKAWKTVSVVVIIVSFFFMGVDLNIATAGILIGVLMFIFLPRIFQKKHNREKYNMRVEDIHNFNKGDFENYSLYFYKCVSNILAENNKIYLELNDFEFPHFRIEELAIKIFLDVKDKDSDLFLYEFDYEYFEKIFRQEAYTKPYKYFKNKIFMLWGDGRRDSKESLFNSNLERIALGADNAIKAKMHNNCIATYKSDRQGYGIKAKEEGNMSYIVKEVQAYYAYFTDSFFSAILIAYLMFLSEKIKSINCDEEFIKIVLKMVKEIKDKEVVYKKLYELYREFYRFEYDYAGEIDTFKIFVNLVDSIQNDVIGEKEKSIINDEVNSQASETKISYKMLIKNMICKLAEYSGEYDENEIKSFVAEKIRCTNLSSCSEMFDLLASMPEFVRYYNDTVKANVLAKERERYLNGDFSRLKENADIKQEYNNIHTGIEFEEYLTRLFKRCGYETKHTGKAGDQGCDLIVKKNNYIYCVQAKYYSNPLNNTPVQEIVGSLKYYGGDRGVVITNSSFTAGAKKLAKTNNVILVDGEKLEKIIEYLLNDNDSKKDILKKIDEL